ncbi:MAG: polysaccharide biosynthesis protein [Phycisphaeraceae bacterium]|nr:polysaccharide biosynthesis protein [Phycisphaeraceae bacterium]
MTEPLSPGRALLVASARHAPGAALMLEQARSRWHLVASALPAVWRDKQAQPLLDAVREANAGIVLISLPAAMMAFARELAQHLTQHDIPWRFLPTAEDLLAGVAATLNPSRAASGMMFGTYETAGGTIDTVNLINRQPRPLDEDAIRRVITDQTVLITGAGGSIGSELARIVCRFHPAKLLLLERSENALFEIDRQIARLYPEQARRAVLHDIAGAARTRALLEELHPDVLFHAAAHKHVPMMEHHPAEAVENNFFGTRSIADAARACGAKRFVMISSDKAVNPSSVMGATKRLAERYIQWLGGQGPTVFSMVRFGNVLGSACSVLPIWSQQLAQGLPLTVTHPDMTRYFMTIPEAAGLVIQSAAYAEGGEVFLLDMGQPVRILDLAKRFLRQHGLEPDVDVPIQITGIRPGEKLFEELAYGSEAMLPTPHPSIRRWQTMAPTTAQMRRIIATFDRLRDGDHPWQHATSQTILSALHMAVPEMRSPATQRAAG